MSAHKGWIGVDLDGTLAQYDGWQGITSIGEPVLPMLARVREWIERGREVRIFTARVSPVSLAMNGNTRNEVIGPINAWCFNHIGMHLQVTHEKDFGMIELWDDRCVQIIPNTGMRADGEN